MVFRHAKHVNALYRRSSQWRSVLASATCVPLHGRVAAPALVHRGRCTACSLSHCLSPSSRSTAAPACWPFRRYLAFDEWWGPRLTDHMPRVIGREAAAGRIRAYAADPAVDSKVWIVDDYIYAPGAANATPVAVTAAAATATNVATDAAAAATGGAAASDEDGGPAAATAEVRGVHRPSRPLASLLSAVAHAGTSACRCTTPSTPTGGSMIRSSSRGDVARTASAGCGRAAARMPRAHSGMPGKASAASFI